MKTESSKNHQKVKWGRHLKLEADSGAGQGLVWPEINADAQRLKENLQLEEV